MSTVNAKAKLETFVKKAILASQYKTKAFYEVLEDLIQAAYEEGWDEGYDKGRADEMHAPSSEDY